LKRSYYVTFISCHYFLATALRTNDKYGIHHSTQAKVLQLS